MSEFSSLKIVGGLLSSDLLGRIFAGDSQVPGHEPGDLRPGARRVGPPPGVPVLAVPPGDLAGREEARPLVIRILLRELGFPQQMPEHIAFRARRLGRRPGPSDSEPRGPRPAVGDAGAAQPRRLPAVGHALQRDDSAAAPRLRHTGRLVLRRVRPARRSSTANCSPTSCCCTWPATSPASRSTGDGGPESCYLEQWRTFAANQGERVLDQLRTGVEPGDLDPRHRLHLPPGNPQLRVASREDELRLDDLNRALLRLVYRMLFWFVAEDRDALLIPSPPNADAIPSVETQARLREARDRYTSTSPPTGSAAWPAGSAAPATPTSSRPSSSSSTPWAPKAASLSWPSRHRRHLRVPPHDGSALALDEPLAGARLSNEALLSAVRALALVQVPRRRRDPPRRLRQPRRGRTRQRSTSPCWS